MQTQFPTTTTMVVPLASWVVVCVQYLCVAVVPVQHRGVAPDQPTYEAHQPGCLAAGQGVPHLLCQHWNTSPPKAH